MSLELILFMLKFGEEKLIFQRSILDQKSSSSTQPFQLLPLKLVCISNYHYCQVNGHSVGDQLFLAVMISGLLKWKNHSHQKAQNVFLQKFFFFLNEANTKKKKPLKFQEHLFIQKQEALPKSAQRETAQHER